MLVYDENRVWVRITNFCNSRCKFCLDSFAIKSGIRIKDDEIMKLIKDGFMPGRKNKLILSGGEASVDPRLLQFIEYGKSLGYDKIQTVTNGNRWEDAKYCDDAVKAGLSEITFSLHGHNSEVHDGLTQNPGSFKRIIKSIHNFKSKHPEIIMNVDIVVCKQNIKDAHKIVQIMKKFGIYEFDILQVIPFGDARDYKDEMLFDDVMSYKDDFIKIWHESDAPGVYMWANRVDPRLLEGYEHLIQSPEKIQDEVLSYERAVENNLAFVQGKAFWCKEDERCANCYVKDFCDKMNEFHQQRMVKLGDDLDGFMSLNNSELVHKNGVMNKTKNSNGTVYNDSEGKTYYKLYTDRSISKINKYYPENIDEFLALVRGKAENVDYVVNAPYCIVNKGNKFEIFMDFLKTGKNYKNNDNLIDDLDDLNLEMKSLENVTLDDFIGRYEDEGYMIKGSGCEGCKIFEKCEGIHLNLIKKYGFKLLKKIE